MKKMFLVVCVILLSVAMVGLANAQASKLSLNIGANVQIPMGTFGDAQSIGFGGTVQGEYAFLPNLSGTVKTGYLVWSGKDYSQGGFTVKGGNYKGLPFLVGAKYYFVPPVTGGIRWYGQAEIGLFFGSVSTPEIPGIVIPGFGTIGGAAAGSVSSTDFVFSPTVGMEYGMGKGALDAGVNYFLIASSGSAGSIGVRVGYKFAL